MALGLRQAGHEVRLLCPPSVVGRLWPSAGGIGKWLGHGDKLGLFPAVLRYAIRDTDVVHICDHSNAIYTKYLGPVPLVVTCHDLLGIRSALGEIPLSPTSWTGRILQGMVLQGLKQAQHVACVSDSTRCDLLRIARVAQQRVSVVYNSLNYPYSPMVTSEAKVRLSKLRVDANQRFILHVGGNQWYKNRLGVLRIFSILRKFPAVDAPHLVMVGQPWTAEMRRFISENRLSEITKELVGISNEDLRALYSTAQMMLFPSFYEGFGWPIVEAQACGCPVAIPDEPPMNELGGNAAVYIDARQPGSAALALKRALHNVSHLRQRSIANAARFRSGMIDSYLALYKRVVVEKSGATIREPDVALARQSGCSANGVR